MATLTALHFNPLLPAHGGLATRRRWGKQAARQREQPRHLPRRIDEEAPVVSQRKALLFFKARYAYHSPQRPPPFLLPEHHTRKRPPSFHLAKARSSHLRPHQPRRRLTPHPRAHSTPHPKRTKTSTQPISKTNGYHWRLRAICPLSFLREDPLKRTDVNPPPRAKKGALPFPKNSQNPPQPLTTNSEFRTFESRTFF